MKHIIGIASTIALLSSICLGAEPQTIEAGTQASAEMKRKADKEIQRAVDEANIASKKAMEQAQRALRQQLAGVGEPGENGGGYGGGYGVAGGAYSGYGGVIGHELPFGPSSRAASQALIIRSAELEPKTVANIQEDLAVMSRILNKTVEREVGRDAAMGIVISTLPGVRRPQSIYLEGYGALFVLNVKFPLLEPPTKDEEKNERTADTTWEQTRRELYIPEGVGKPRVLAWDSASVESAEYDADQVENLKRALLESLKNATNIREVKPGESITITVIGTQPPSNTKRIKTVSRSTGVNSRKMEVYALADVSGTGPRESVMTLRAKKADVDAFAKGELNADQFKQRVAIVAY